MQERMYTVVGIFVVGALLLFLYSAYFFYETYIRQQRETYVMFFKGSLDGLDSRSPITYRGVKIGEVLRIEITENKINNSVEIPVYVQFFVERTIGFKQNPIQLLIEQGYIADISKPNLISGVSSIKLVQPKTLQEVYRPKYYHFPVFPTTRIVERHTSVDDTLKAAETTLSDISNFIRSQEIKDMIKSIDHMTASIEKLANQLNLNVPPFMANFSQGMEQLSKAATSARNFIDYLSRYPESLLRGRA
jgi:ABC-type transporter Mla subunit MlaD